MPQMSNQDRAHLVLSAQKMRCQETIILFFADSSFRELVSMKKWRESKEYSYCKKDQLGAYLRETLR